MSTSNKEEKTILNELTETKSSQKQTLPKLKDKSIADNKKKLINAMTNSLGIVTDACKIVGISTVTYYSYLNSDAEFREQIESTKQVTNEDIVDEAEKALMRGLEKDNTSLIMYILDTKGKKRYNKNLEKDTIIPVLTNGVDTTLVYADILNSLRNGYKIIINRGGTRCFASDTLVKTFQGYKKISDIKIGDLVLSTNLKTKKTEFKKVLKIFFTPRNKTNKKIVFLDNNIVCTYDHKVLYQGKWVEIEKINSKSSQNNKLIQTSYICNKEINTSREITVQETQIKKVQYGGYDLYDLEVEDNHNYCITKDNIIVHNSSKTYSIAQLVVDWLITGELGGLEIKTKSDGIQVVEILRKWGNRAMDTIGRDIEEILNKRNYKLKFGGNRFLFKEKGEVVRELQISGMDNIQKKKGKKRTFVWLNEADEFTVEDYQSLMSRNETGIVLMDFNPTHEGWIKTDLEEIRSKDKKDVVVLKSSHKLNSFLDDENRENIEYLCGIDPYYKSVFGDGEYSTPVNVIFKFNTFKDLPKDKHYDTIMGLDWGGGGAGATAVVKIYIDRNSRNIYIYLIYYNRSSSHELAEKSISNNWNKEGGRYNVVCDTNTQESNVLLNVLLVESTKNHVRVEGAKKEAGSVLNSINLLKNNFIINIHEQSTEIIKELKMYRWVQNKNGGTENKPIKTNDHSIDAIRYGIYNWSYSNLPNHLKRIKKNE